MKEGNLIFRVNKFIILIFSIFILAHQTANATQADLDSELKNYIEIFSSSNFANQRKAIESLGWAGISDPALFDVIESKLLDLYLNKDKISKEQAAWYAKTLALSGNPKYIPTLENVIDTGPRKIKKHAKTALERIAQYQTWNPIITARLDVAPAGKLEESRIRNMLASSRPSLSIIGAKRIYYAHSDDRSLVELVSDKLRQDYQSVTTGVEVDQIAWFIKVLAQSGDSSYKPLLESIANDANEKKIVRYAKKYSDYL